MIRPHQLPGRACIAGEEFTIADMTAGGRVDRAKFVVLGVEDEMAPLKKEQNEEVRCHLYPSNDPPAA